MDLLAWWLHLAEARYGVLGSAWQKRKLTFAEPACVGFVDLFLTRRINQFDPLYRCERQ